jgi:hypothetical protein
MEPPTPEAQNTAQGCILGILAVVVMVGLSCFTVAALIVTVQWALGR